MTPDEEDMFMMYCVLKVLVKRAGGRVELSQDEISATEGFQLHGFSEGEKFVVELAPGEIQ